ncbi:MAG: hypothetical protein JXQ27_06560 [Acidobacteria bacterium]|nr:hypothetical protein [Acidobacteriota bacterium]
MVHVLKIEIAMVGRSSQLAGGILGRLTPTPAVVPGPKESLEIGEPASPGAAPFGGTSAMVHAARLTAHQAALVDIRRLLDDFRQASQRFHEQIHRLEAGLRPGGSAEPGVAVPARDRLSVTALAMGTPAEGRHCLEELARFTECFARTPEPSSREELSGPPSRYWPPDLHLVPPMPDVLQQHSAFDAAQDFHDRVDRVQMSRIKLVRLADPSVAAAPDVTAEPVPAPAFLERLCGVLDSAETMNRVLGQRFHQFRF